MFTISVSRLGGEEQDGLPRPPGGLLEGAGGGAKIWRSGDSKGTAKIVQPLLGPMLKKLKINIPLPIKNVFFLY
jgi:hypothetical protein